LSTQAASPAEAPPQVLKAALWMLGVIASFSTMAVAGREVSFALDTFEIMMYRSFVGLGIVCTLLTVTGSWRQVTRRSLGLHMIRNTAHFTGQNLWFFAVISVPLAQVVALEFTLPLWVIVLSPAILGERLTAVRALAAVIGFAGVLIVARPWTEPVTPGIITAAMAAIFFALSALFTKKLTRTETVACIMFYLTLMQAVLGIIFSGWDGDVALPTWETAPYIVLIGVAGLTAHFCLTNALAIAPATVVMPLDFARLPVIAMVGMLIYGEALVIWVFVGAVVIFGANYLNIWTETRRNRVA
jgi:drug/metabolite transporter (DMT)-like permease